MAAYFDFASTEGLFAELEYYFGSLHYSDAVLLAHLGKAGDAAFGPFGIAAFSAPTTFATASYPLLLPDTNSNNKYRHGHLFFGFWGSCWSGCFEIADSSCSTRADSGCTVVAEGLGRQT